MLLANEMESPKKFNVGEEFFMRAMRGDYRCEIFLHRTLVPVFSFVMIPSLISETLAHK